jgi:succinoglycan biosynthesis protein ExoU
MRRAFLERNDLGYDETMRLGEDFDLYARALLAGGKMRLTPWTGYMSVMRRGSLSLNHSRGDILGLVAASDRLLASGRLSAGDAKLVRRHRANTRARIVWIDLIHAAKAGNAFRAASIMLKEPGQAPYVMRGLILTAFDRLRGLKR